MDQWEGHGPGPHVRIRRGRAGVKSIIFMATISRVYDIAGQDMGSLSSRLFLLTCLAAVVCLWAPRTCSPKTVAAMAPKRHGQSQGSSLFSTCFSIRRRVSNTDRDLKTDMFFPITRAWRRHRSQTVSYRRSLRVVSISISGFRCRRCIFPSALPRCRQCGL